MKVLVNVFHPKLETSRVNRRWSEAASRNPDVTVNRLYEKYPEWEFDVAREQQLLAQHDRIVFQHPFYWYSCPPLMKKWLDEVLTYGWAYGPGATALRGKEWISAISTGGPAMAYQAGGFNSFSISELLKPFQQTAGLCGMAYLPCFSIHDSLRVEESLIEKTAHDYVAYITNPDSNPQVLFRKMMGGA